MRLIQLPVALWLLAWAGVIGSYVLSAQGGYVDWCLPHIQGCDSISASGRHGWGFFLFKATMLPVAALLVVYWYLSWIWLGALEPRRASHHWILWLGIAGSVFLVLYVTFLGSDGDVYRLMRRYGTVGYFGGTYLAQLLISYRARHLLPSSTTAKVQVWLGLGMLISGIVFAGIANIAEERAVVQNVSEWLFASALTFYPALTVLLWRATGFRAEFEVTRRAR